MLKMTGITLHPIQFQSGKFPDMPAEFQRIREGDAGPAHFRIGVDQDMNGMFTRSLPGKQADLFRIVNRYLKAVDFPVELTDPADLPGSSDRRGNQDILNSGRGQSFRLGKFGGADSRAIPGGNLPFGDFRTFMGFSMRPQFLSCPGGKIPHDRKVAFKQFQLQNQRRGIQFFFQHQSLLVP